ncbi:hypothetical protein GCM10020366_08410 [Saccharopolyspora gregorii]|uniref:Uncharacterized protein n=1 Tax=Saccharopolyspora gregorii TaxID=33914 RepID=A0ABP6RLJ6_9PSEU
MHGEGDAAAGVADACQLRIGQVGQVGERRPLRLVQAEHVALRAEVHAGAEGAPGTGDDDRAHRVVGGGPDEGLLQLVGHGDGEGVELVRAVQRDDEDAVGAVVADGLHGRFLLVTPV